VCQFSACRARRGTIPTWVERVVTESIEIRPVTAPLDTSIRPPGSKSLTNRALICAALARGRSVLRGVLESEDTRLMIESLRALGLTIVEDHAACTLEITGCDGHISVESADLYIGNSGTSVRFLTALVALGHGRFRLHGTPRMHERPIQDLLDALGRLGIRATSEAGTGCPPVVIDAGGIRMARTQVRSDVSSQFVSAILMVAPCAAVNGPRPTARVEIDGVLVSKPYVTMTLAVMKAFGATVEHDADLTRFEIPTEGYRACDYEIEPDASAASYFWATAAITGGRVRVEGLSRGSLQGDVGFCECLAQMGCDVSYDPRGIAVRGGALQGIDVDMNAISDTVQTLAAVALFAQGPTRIRGVGHIRHKETDRIAALVTELGKLGARVEEHADGLTIIPGPLQGATIETYDDHRMAMSLSLVGLRIPGVVIRDPGCTAKTYPGFFADLRRLTA
jgi:3-phosphoshikimate 1-carboxyvinyltransferase